jgi:predicted HTH transcriptional regulator
VEDLRKKHDSVLRNPLIGKCFFLIKYIEQWGTGTNRMIKKCLSSGLPEPALKIIINYLKTENKINRKMGMQLLGVSKSTLFRIFRSLEDKGLIKKGGKSKNIYYTLV